MLLAYCIAITWPESSLHLLFFTFWQWFSFRGVIVFVDFWFLQWLFSLKYHCSYPFRVYRHDFLSRRVIALAAFNLLAMTISLLLCLRVITLPGFPASAMTAISKMSLQLSWFPDLQWNRFWKRHYIRPYSPTCNDDPPKDKKPFPHNP